MSRPFQPQVPSVSCKDTRHSREGDDRGGTETFYREQEAGRVLTLRGSPPPVCLPDVAHENTLIRQHRYRAKGIQGTPVDDVAKLPTNVLNECKPNYARPQKGLVCAVKKNKVNY